MRVFGPSGLVDIPHDRLYVHTIPLSRCMDRCSRYNLQICKDEYFYSDSVVSLLFIEDNI